MVTKLGLHGLDGGPVLLGPTIGKWVNSTPPNNLSAGYVGIFRWVENPDSINDPQARNANPEDEARIWIDRQWPHIQFVPKTIWIEGPNESNAETIEQAAWFSRFEIKRMKIMEAEGYKCVIGCFGTGRPSRPVLDPSGVAIWTQLLPMLSYAKSNGHLLGLHEYD